MDDRSLRTLHSRYALVGAGHRLAKTMDAILFLVPRPSSIVHRLSSFPIPRHVFDDPGVNHLGAPAEPFYERIAGKHVDAPGYAA